MPTKYDHPLDAIKDGWMIYEATMLGYNLRQRINGVWHYAQVIRPSH